MKRLLRRLPPSLVRWEAVSNHFIEIDKDDEGFYYLVIHTGSRNFGKMMAEFYQDKATENIASKKGLTKQDLIADLKAQGRQAEIAQAIKDFKEPYFGELCYLDGFLFDSYINDMHIAQKMAVKSRQTIADIIVKGLDLLPLEEFETIHNYIDVEHMILRKGAISAQAGEKCLIPINMRDGALICIGKGNPDYNYSAPHGAGRLMSRNEARKRLTLKNYEASMKGIYSSTVNDSTLDEAPDAYKPIDEILENINDTVSVEKIIKPVYNVKASE